MPGREQPGRHRGVADQDALVGEEVVDVDTPGACRATGRCARRRCRRTWRWDGCAGRARSCAARIQLRLRIARRVARARGEHDQLRAHLEAAVAAAVRRRRSGRARRRRGRRSNSTRPTRACVSKRAPAASARGISVTSIDCLAPVGQPSAQLLSPTQRRMLRGLPFTGQPRRARAFDEEVVVARRACPRFGLDVQDALGLVEVRLHRRGSGARRGRARGSQCSSTRLGRAPRHAAVDDRRAADAAALGEEDRRLAEDRRRAGVAVEPLDHGDRVGAERLGAVQRAFLEDRARRARRRAAAPRRSAPPAPVPTTTTSASYVRMTPRRPTTKPSSTFGYAIRVLARDAAQLRAS